MKPRSPIVCILGHVDHGKTTLLDKIRKSDVTSIEQGGITQSIGAYEIKTGIKDYPTDKITFIDTPGHEAFSKLRSRGANIADIAILIIDAKDSVMPQTQESIAHIKNAKIPFIVVINKVDLPDAKPDKVKLDLLKCDVAVEEKGGKIPCVSVSTKTGKGIKELLETILLLSSDMNLITNEKNKAISYIIETKKDKRGIVLSCIIKDGVLQNKDVVFAGNIKAKIRSMFNDKGENICRVIPSSPFELLGFSEIPSIGTELTTFEIKPTQLNEAKKINKTFNLESILKTEKAKKINIILKANSRGSIEAIQDSLSKTESVDIVMSGIGDIHKSDIFLAVSSKSIIIGFGVKIESDAIELAKNEKVIIKTFNIIYELLEELEEVTNLIKKQGSEAKKVKGEANVLARFVIHENTVYGIKIIQGKANINDNIEIYRNNSLIGKSKISSLQIKSSPEKEVKKGQEAGILIIPNLDIKIGDMIKFIL
jgi:translation initiation factor IF-2